MSDRLAADDPALNANICAAEGLRTKAYPDPESPLGKQLALPLNQRAPGWQALSGAPWTCGFGHTGGDVGPKTTCTKAQADAWRLADIADALAILDAKEPWWRTLSLNRQRVLAEMCFNLGFGRLLTFHRMLVDLQVHDFNAAANEMLNSRWTAQVKQGRAQRLADAMRAG